MWFCLICFAPSIVQATTTETNKVYKVCLNSDSFGMKCSFALQCEKDQEQIVPQGPLYLCCVIAQNFLVQEQLPGEPQVKWMGLSCIWGGTVLDRWSRGTHTLMWFKDFQSIILGLLYCGWLHLFRYCLEMVIWHSEDFSSIHHEPQQFILYISRYNWS